MRLILALPLLLGAACSVENDAGNDQMTLEYNEQRINDAAAAAESTVRDVGAGIGNVASSTASAISNEVGDIDVDVNVSRNRNRSDEPATNQAEAR